MKFAEHLGAHITPEWRKQYIQYEEMKAMLYTAMEGAPSAEVVEDEVLQRYFAGFDETFFTFCDKELAKINTFYAEKLAEATRKFATLKSELDEQTQETHQSDGKGFLGRKKVTFAGPKKMDKRKQIDLKLAFSEFYLSLILMQNYQTLNFTGFRKILKKHDKLVRTDAGARWREEFVETSHFHTNKDIDKLIADTEATVTSDLESGDRQKAMKRLRVPPLGDQQSPWTTFKVGLFAGAFIVLLIAVVLSSVFHSYGAVEDYGRSDWRVVIRLYRGPFLLVLFLFLMGVNVYGWRSSGVNHVLIFELDPRNHLSEQHIMELAAVFGVIWTLSVLTFLYSEQLSIPAYANPLALAVIMTAIMLNPTKTFRHEARFWTLRVLSRIFLAPFFYVGFADFWLADQLNSLAQAMGDFQYLVCFYATNGSTVDNSWDTAADVGYCAQKTFWIVPIVSALPAWFRFAQCLRRYRDTREAFPHLVNAGKYSTTFFHVIFSTLTAVYGLRDDQGNLSPFFYLWIISSVVSSTYAYVWDIKMDWGFFAANAGDNRFLREECVYTFKSYYYFAIVEDFVLRFAWSISLAISASPGLAGHGDLVTTVLAPLEVVRRFVWNFFRLENEHLNNCGKFRAVRDISVAPIDASDQQQIIKMMDEPDPSVYFRRRKAKKNGGITATAHSSSKVPLLQDTDDIPDVSVVKV
jgi:hypothetical protein